MSDTPPISSQAEAMLRRVSPEGRARAAREQDKRRRATMRVVGRCLLALLVIGLVMAVVGASTAPVTPIGWLAALVVYALTCAGIAYASREAPPSTAGIAGASLVALPERTAGWLEQQRAALPAPAARLLDGIELRLEAMAPQLRELDPRSAGADAVRNLLAVELPNLIERHHRIPATLRADERDGRPSADAHLANGLGIVDAEIARMTEQLARGAFDELATQNRFLELKYEGEGGLG
ncbi:MAG: hypothetical protein JWL96_2708 [Sphingomonas bacterium]|uniref:hypothetical protein n=1 Tax=Sphingomonas bacterium TaxID=1895847 RepID=UPI002601C24D|nr:hypothetical protein [Sphingomonas bacterium]MDB5710638.1 hypothetical protein [Sphingomonas bacterium]